METKSSIKIDFAVPKNIVDEVREKVQAAGIDIEILTIPMTAGMVGGMRVVIESHHFKCISTAINNSTLHVQGGRSSVNRELIAISACSGP